ncbi:adenylate/guanylate cyclase domain-containing protein [Curvibacter sp. APW13]|uniref:adenylate/guanylate cyclase domain-containing protein n=1 Tax=Curvibacter sp. APW13 TaxID=3077236 RepID=UPI0028DF7C77|nr:adenylate/guanylate cyclase domain-containing protein [Curvibacter sp. APW13]MDT8991834.1 adenylate/guanylate cyclase domain-containing protein [Curvibacter sp. APW13]
MSFAHPEPKTANAMAQVFLGHAGHVPLALIILEALQAQPGYFAGMDAYLLLAAGVSQAWFAHRFRASPRTGRVLSNFVGPALYSLGEFAAEGTNFLAQWHHLAYWGFALAFALVQGAQLGWRHAKVAATVGESVVRASIPLVTYALFEAHADGKALSFSVFWADMTHQYLSIVLLLLGTLMGFLEVNLQRAQAAVRALTDQLHVYSSWALGHNVLERALEDVRTLSLKRMHRALLFVDIRGFTAWSEQRTPEEVVQMLNRFYAESEGALGTTPIKLKYTADEILAVFEHTEQALAAAQALLTQLHTTLEPLNLSAGAGLHYGPVVEGVLGGSQSKAYDVIGDTVNTAQRLCDAAQSWELLLSEAAVASGTCKPTTWRSIQVKGKAHALSVASLRLPS